jgi:cytochrome c biogenesis factor
VRRVVHGVLFLALAAGVFGVLPRLGGLTRDAAGLRHARPTFVIAAVVAQAASLGYAQL